MKTIRFSHAIAIAVLALSVGCSDDETAGETGSGGTSGGTGGVGGGNTNGSGGDGGTALSPDLEEACFGFCSLIESFESMSGCADSNCLAECEMAAGGAADPSDECVAAFQAQGSMCLTPDCDELAQCEADAFDVFASEVCGGESAEGCSFDCDSCEAGIQLQCNEAAAACEEQNMDNPSGLALCCDSVTTAYSPICP